MAEIIINIAAEKEQLITELVKQLGGSIIEKKINKQKKTISKKAKNSAKEQLNNVNNNKKKSKAVDHTYLFGKWKDFDIDARKLREQSW